MSTSHAAKCILRDDTFHRARRSWFWTSLASTVLITCALAQPSLADPLAVPQGGTGAASLTGVLKGNGTSPVASATAGTDYLAPTGSGAGLTGITASQVGALPLTGGTLTGNLAAVGSVTSSVAKNGNALFGLQTNGTQKWSIYTNDTETGSNGGANLYIGAYGDTGAYLNSGLTITRSTGIVTIPGALNVNGGMSVTQGIASLGASAGFSTVDRTTGGQSIFYRAGGQTRLWDSAYGDVITYTNAGVVGLPRLGVNTATPVGLVDLKEKANEHVNFVADVNGNWPGATGITSINDNNTGYTPLGFLASSYDFVSGNVGIGTNAPAYPLDVNGAARIGSTLFMTAAGANAEIGSSTTANSPYIDFHSSGSGNYDARILASGGAAGTSGQGTLAFLGGGFSFAGPLTMADTAQSFNPTSVPGRYVGDSVKDQSGNSCLPSAGGFETQSAALGRSPTQSWVPTCSGSWMGSNILQVPTYDVIGVGCITSDAAGDCASPLQPDPTALMSSQLLVQSIAVATTEFQSALTVNMDSANGANGYVNGTYKKTNRVSNNVAITGYMRTHAFPDGTPAPASWVFNPEIECGPGSQGSLCLTEELDYVNFDKACPVDSCSGLHAVSWISPFGNLSGVGQFFSDAGTSNYRGSVTITGATIARGSIHAFSSDTTTIYIGSDSNPYRVIPGSQSANSLTLTQSPPASEQGSQSITFNSHALSDGIFMIHDELVAEYDFESDDSAEAMLFAGGHHETVLDSSNDSAPYGLVLGQEQQMCFTNNNEVKDRCLVWHGNKINHLSYVVGGVTMASFDDNGNVRARGNFLSNVNPDSN